MADPPAAEEVYVAVRHGVRDALWDVLGTLSLVAFAVLLFAFGLGAVSAAVQSAAPASYALGALALALLAASAYQLMAALGQQPRDWL